MNVNVPIPANIEPMLQQYAAAAGLGVPEFIRSVVTEKVVGASAAFARPRKMSHDEYTKKLMAWIGAHPAAGRAIDDSRESMYEGCGE